MNSANIDEILTTHQNDRNSFFQLKHFVVAKNYTNQGKMWKCLDEIGTRKITIASLKSEIDELNDRVELLCIEKERIQIAVLPTTGTNNVERSLKLCERERAIKERQIDRKIDALKKSITSLQKQIVGAQEEMEFFVREFEQIHNVEPCRSRDDLDAQKEFWDTKLFHEVNLRSLLGQTIDVEFVKMILSLHDESELKKQMIDFLDTNHKKLLQKNKKEAN